MGTARFVYTQQDLIAAQRAWWAGAARWQLFAKLAAGLMLAYVAIALFITWDTPVWARAQAAAIAILIAFTTAVLQFLTGFLLSSYRARRAYREHKALRGEFVWSWNAKGMTITAVHGTANLPWPVLLDWQVGPETLLLYQTSALFNGMPRRALAPGNVEEIVGHLRAAGVAERKRFGFLAWKAR